MPSRITITIITVTTTTLNLTGVPAALSGTPEHDPARACYFYGMSTQPVSDPCYPIGKFSNPAVIDSAHIRGCIATLAALPENLRAAVDRLTKAQIDTPYREGGWTVRQLVHHIADSHMNAYVRTRLALTEDWPTIKAYDEKAWAELADARTLPIEVSLELLESLHRRWVALFESLTEEQWQRGYNHSENGRTPLAQALCLYDWHSRHHVAHIVALRKSRGW
ncbi:MAG TPA: putative metal-dependent hydrolase [Silvibacterium sp.]|nr:putative metal-dependent hydrolase [Silvibacterium sp.]